MAKKYVQFNIQKKIKAGKNGDKDGKVLHKFMNNTAYGKTMENLRNRIEVKLVSNRKGYLKFKSKSNNISHKIFDNYLVAIHNNKVTLTLNKPAYIKKCILELSKVLMYEFHHDYIKNKYGNNSRLLFTNTDRLKIKMKLKLKMSMKILATIKKCLTLVIIQLSQNIMMIQTN